MFWRRAKNVSNEELDRVREEGWVACLDAIEHFLDQHSWVTEEDDRKEIFCDGCGASLHKKLRSMRTGPEP